MTDIWSPALKGYSDIALADLNMKMNARYAYMYKKFYEESRKVQSKFMERVRSEARRNDFSY